jgi:NAD(P)-dependent dehydrogenase (short-subunit alcohol dehydrogenase family)
LPFAQARRQFDTNLFGLARLTQLVIPGMRQAGGGTIITLSSVFGRFAFAATRTTPPPSTPSRPSPTRSGRNWPPPSTGLPVSGKQLLVS